MSANKKNTKNTDNIEDYVKSSRFVIDLEKVISLIDKYQESLPPDDELSVRIGGSPNLIHSWRSAQKKGNRSRAIKTVFAERLVKELGFELTVIQSGDMPKYRKLQNPIKIVDSYDAITGETFSSVDSPLNAAKHELTKIFEIDDNQNQSKTLELILVTALSFVDDYPTLAQIIIESVKDKKDLAFSLLEELFREEQNHLLVLEMLRGVYNNLFALSAEEKENKVYFDPKEKWQKRERLIDALHQKGRLEILRDDNYFDKKEKDYWWLHFLFLKLFQVTGKEEHLARLKTVKDIETAYNKELEQKKQTCEKKGEEWTNAHDVRLSVLKKIIRGEYSLFDELFIMRNKNEKKKEDKTFLEFTIEVLARNLMDSFSSDEFGLYKEKEIIKELSKRSAEDAL